MPAGDLEAAGPLPRAPQPLADAGRLPWEGSAPTSRNLGGERACHCEAGTRDARSDRAEWRPCPHRNVPCSTACTDMILQGPCSRVPGFRSSPPSTDTELIAPLASTLGSSQAPADLPQALARARDLSALKYLPERPPLRLDREWTVLLSQSRRLSLRTVMDTTGHVTLCWAAVSSLTGHLAASLAFAHQMPITD